MKSVVRSSLSVAVGLSVCGVAGYILYLILKKDEDEYKTNRKQSNYKTVEVSVPKEHVRALIGRNGKNIKAIQDETHTRIAFKDDDDSKVRVCVIRGNRDSCSHAKNLIQEFIMSQPSITTEDMYVPANIVGKIIGRCGENIMEISSKSGAKINVDNNKSESKRKITLKGTEDQISFAKLLIIDIINLHQELQTKMEATLAKREPRTQSKTLPSLNVDSPKVERLSPIPGQTDTQFEVYVSAMIDPSHFWLQIVGPKATELDQLIEDMTEYYGKEENKNLHVLNSVESGDLVAAIFMFDKKWYRAEVLKVIHENGSDSQAELYYVDYGDTGWVSCKELFELRTDFLRLNFQAIECFLAQVEPKDGSWSNEALDKFEEWAHVARWKKLLAKMNGYCVREKVRAKREGSPVPGVDLYDVTNDGDVDIAQELVNHGYAVFKKEIDLRTSV